VISFAFALLLSAYHFSTFIIRRKRKCDHTDIPRNEKIGKTA
jgi:hypothetical protein